MNSTAATMDSFSQSQADSGCFHCGLPVSTSNRFQISFDGKMRALCCAGCEAVAQTIIESGWSDYYRTRTQISAAPPAGLIGRTGADIFSVKEVREQYVAQSGNTETADIYVDGITCAACVWLAESSFARIAGVTSATINPVTHRATLTWTAGTTDLPALIDSLEKIGLTGAPASAPGRADSRKKARRKALIELGVALLSMMQVMMFTVPFYFANADDIGVETSRLMGWAAMVLTLPALLYSARTFFSGAWRDLRMQRVSMDLPIALAIVAAFTSSTAAVIRGTGDQYFDSISMFVFLLLSARYIEFSARSAALDVLEKLTNATPAIATRFENHPALAQTTQVAASSLVVGDVIRISTGEVAPADGSVVEGMTEFDESLLSGESRPVAKKAGDFIAGGSLNLGQPLSVRVSSVGGDTVASRIGQLTEKALAARPRMADVADKVARWISPLTLLTAILASVFWLAVDPSRSFSVAVAILAVTCPCALALAVPAAHALATTRLAREGLLFTRAGALDRLAEIDTLLFDKTGTLTRADISIDAVHELGSLPRNEILVIASSIEAGSAHPIARAIDLLAKSGEGIDESYPHATQLRYFGGAGVEGEIGGIAYRLGHEQFVRELTGATAHIADIASTIYLGRKGEWLAGFDLSDAPKNDAQTTIARLRKQRLNLYVVSGDQQDRVDATAVALNIKPECAKGQLDPDGKLKFAKALTDQGAIVGAIGDGVNDAPLLGAAQVSIAMGSGASLASMTGDAVLMSASLAPVADAVAVAKKMKQIIRQNFVWGIAYNIIAVPLAVAGLVSPAWAAIGMASSSLIVVANSLRLTRINGRSI